MKRPIPRCPSSVDERPAWAVKFSRLSVALVVLCLALLQATPGDAKRIHACRKKIGGAVRIVGARTVCSATEVRMSWSSLGPLSAYDADGRYLCDVMNLSSRTNELEISCFNRTVGKYFKLVDYGPQAFIATSVELWYPTADCSGPAYYQGDQFQLFAGEAGNPNCYIFEGAPVSITLGYRKTLFPPLCERQIPFTGPRRQLVEVPCPFPLPVEGPITIHH